jgi:hypothetical protein
MASSSGKDPLEAIIFLTEKLEKAEAHNKLLVKKLAKASEKRVVETGEEEARKSAKKKKSAAAASEDAPAPPPLPKKKAPTCKHCKLPRKGHNHDACAEALKEEKERKAQKKQTDALKKIAKEMRGE